MSVTKIDFEIPSYSSLGNILLSEYRRSGGGVEVDEIKHAHSKRLDAVYKENAELKDAIYKMFMAMKTPDQFVISPNFVENVDQWCKENCNGEYEVFLNHSNLGSLVVFDNSRDATLFKLFCGY